MKAPKWTLQYFNSISLFIFQVLETYNYEDIGEVSTVKQNGLKMVMHTGGRVQLNSDKSGRLNIKAWDMLLFRKFVHRMKSCKRRIVNGHIIKKAATLRT